MKIKLILCFVALAFGSNVFAQDNLYGDVKNRAKNVHAGNLVRITFHNNGRLGSVKGDQTPAYTGEWPIGSGKVQMGNTSAYVMSEMRLPKPGTDSLVVVTPAVFCEGWDPNIFSHDKLGRFQGFEPLPGFYSIAQKEKDPNHAVAMSHQAYTWPASWPDKTTDVIDAGWKNHWNGYFGKDQKNADEESYYVMDDNQYDKKLKALSLPLPTADPIRLGLGLRVGVRGLQWSNPDAEDCIFWLYDIRNFGKLTLDKTLFGTNVGASSGASLTISGSDYDDDGSRFYREKGLAVNFDLDNLGVGGYSPVPWVGFAFLESPGNPYDGIDNDGDGNNFAKTGGGTGKIITEADFVKTYAVNEPIVLIDYDSKLFTRKLSTMPAAGVSITRNGIKYSFKPNAPLIEIERDGIDNNLNGLIDESDGSMTPDSVKYFLYIKSDVNNRDYLAIDYFTGAGTANLLIDERRDDGLDNDGDWNSQFDDVGLDGKPATGDYGEGDGVPTPGTSELPGEPNVDRVDVDESDQIGLTSFKFYKYSSLTYSNDDQMWDYSRPGYFDNKTTERADYDYVFASGYFPLRPEQKEFFSLAMLYGWDETDILRNKDVVQKIYDSNYNFAMAPNKPKVTAIAGDRKVTLYWDEGSEASFDRFLKTYDFEGYKVYKSSHYTFGDAGSITDGLGYERFKKPIAIYDKIDSVYGFFPKDFGTGVLFNLGNESGLVHSFVDNDVQNGVKYYYAVTAFDKGDAEKNIGPSETTIYLNVDLAGNIVLSENVVIATPQAPALGYEQPKFDLQPTLQGSGSTNGFVGVTLIDKEKFNKDEEYSIQFLDQSMDKRDNDLNGKIDGKDSNELLPNLTTGMVLKNLTTNAVYDTVWIKEYAKVGASFYETKNMYEDNDGEPTTFTSVINGMSIYVKNPLPGLINSTQRGIKNGIQWSKNIDTAKTYNVLFSLFSNPTFVGGLSYPRQYKVVFYNTIVDTSDQISIKIKTGAGSVPIPKVPVNFKVFDLQSGQKLRFAFVDNTKTLKVAAPKGFYSAKDNIILYEKMNDGTTAVTYQLLNNSVEDSTFYAKYNRFLGEGDTLKCYPDFPFNGNTVYKFKVQGQKINQETAKVQLSRIKVVPNPYAATALWEPQNPYSNGRGPRLVQFINLPQKCTIRIYAVDGSLVRTLDHDSMMSDGSEPWDLMSSDNMDISYGIYIYHIEAPGIGEHVGRMLVIK